MSKTVNKFLLPLLVAGALPVAMPAFADVSSQQDEGVLGAADEIADSLNQDSVIIGYRDTKVSLPEPAVENYEVRLNADIAAAVLARVNAAGLPAEGLQVETSVRRLDLRSTNKEFDPDRSRLRLSSRITDGSGRVIDTIPVSLLAYPGEVPVENATVVPPSMTSYYDAMVDYYADKVVEDLRARL